MTPNKRPLKTIPFHYSELSGRYRYDNGSVAFGETDKKEMRRKNKRIVKSDAYGVCKMA